MRRTRLTAKKQHRPAHVLRGPVLHFLLVVNCRGSAAASYFEVTVTWNPASLSALTIACASKSPSTTMVLLFGATVLPVTPATPLHASPIALAAFSIDRYQSALSNDARCGELPPAASIRPRRVHRGSPTRKGRRNEIRIASCGDDGRLAAGADDGLG
jgi:hypothetical protein